MRVVRAILILIASLVIGAMTALCWLIPGRRRRWRVIMWSRRLWALLLLRTIRFRVNPHFPPVDLWTPALYVGNHTGYLDTLVAMSVIPGRFVSRSLHAWPIIGQLALIGGTIFIARTRKSNVVQQVEKLRSLLRKGDGIFLFPEGTSTNGDTIIPFKTSLFAAVEPQDGEWFPVRPVVLVYRTIGGNRIDATNRDYIYWYDNMDFATHFWRLLAARGVEVDVYMLAERRISGNRKEFAQQVRNEMLEKLKFERTAAS